MKSKQNHTIQTEISLWNRLHYVRYILIIIFKNKGVDLIIYIDYGL